MRLVLSTLAETYNNKGQPCRRDKRSASSRRCNEWLLAVGNEKERRASSPGPDPRSAASHSAAGASRWRASTRTPDGIEKTGLCSKSRSFSPQGLNSGSTEIRLLHHEIRGVSATITEDAGERDSLNSWIADGAFAKILSSEHDDFSWAAKRNERRCQQEARRRNQAV
ncbi:hypothetical protein [Mesorhizobium sp.]|uniref:hypothetical protein n=1 Tax=Mesorhizobium sp. TaxID=1871066 RepID=UPI00257B8504|nr:hypothetical protein [Mesorhizobium sp.]